MALERVLTIHLTAMECLNLTAFLLMPPKQNREGTRLKGIMVPTSLWSSYLNWVPLWAAGGLLEEVSDLLQQPSNLTAFLEFLEQLSPAQTGSRLHN